MATTRAEIRAKNRRYYIKTAKAEYKIYLNWKKIGRNESNAQIHLRNAEKAHQSYLYNGGRTTNFATFISKK